MSPFPSNVGLRKVVLKNACVLVKPRSHIVVYIFPLFTIQINSAIVNNLKPIVMMKIQCVTIYPNIYECVSENIKIHHDRF